MQKTVIKNGRVIDPANKFDSKADIYIADGRIIAIGAKPQSFTVEKEIIADSMVVCPGLIDLYCHLNNLDNTGAINLSSELTAAASAGITHLCSNPNTQPIIETAIISQYLQQQARNFGKTQVLPLGALTRQLQGQELSDIATLQQAGCIAMSNAEKPIDNNLLLRRCFEYAASHNITVFLYPQDTSLAGNGVMHEGKVAMHLGLTGIPTTAETVALARDLLLIEQTGVKAHFIKLSSGRAVEMLASAQAKGLAVTASVALQNLFLTEMDVDHSNTNMHLYPPLRSLQDQQALLQGIKHGVITAICSDHHPLPKSAKEKPFANSEAGASSIDAFLPLSLRLVELLDMSLSQVLALLTINPATILGLDIGRITVGATADLCILDPELYWTLNQENLQSHGKNSPYLGWDLRGKVQYTLIYR
ncbi:dihydroorotase [soil metagenome]